MYKILTDTLFIGKELVHLPMCHSTNDIASDLLARGRPEGLVVVADHQTQGKGQRGNSWAAAPNQNLTFSLVLRPTFILPSEQFSLNIIISLALWDWAREQGLAAELKWPNDLYVDGRKMAGILIENTLKGHAIDGSVVGIGLNINQVDFGSLLATSLRLETGQQGMLPEVLASLLCRIEARYLQGKQGKLPQLRMQYEQALLGMGEWRWYEVEGSRVEGCLQGVTVQGMVLITNKKGEATAYAHGDIQWLF